jgi:serine/threonine-protein kinase RsbW
MAAEPPGAAARDRIEVTVPLRPSFAATVRTVAAAVGSDAGFSVDELDDLRLALSEVFSVLADAAPEAGRARVTFSTEPGQVTVVIGSEAGDVPIELDDLARNILSSVTDEYSLGSDGLAFSKRSSDLVDERRAP